MKRQGRMFRWLAALAVLAGGAWYFQSNTKEATALETAVVVRGTLEMVAAASGSVEADVRVEVKSRASGEVVEIAVQAGDVVAQGDLLVRLDPADEERKLEAAEAAFTTARARLAQARSSLASSRASLAEERGRHERRRAAFAAGLVSGEELAAARTSVEVATEAVAQREAEVASARASQDQAQLSIDEARKRLAETIIKSPVAGTVLAVEVERGSIVASGISNVGGGTALLTVADLSSLHVMVKLDEASIGTVRAGQPVRIRVDAFPMRTFAGEIDRVTPLGVNVSNIVTFDVKVRIIDPAMRLLLPGMGTDVEIVTARHVDVLLVPNAALRRGSDTRAVANQAREASTVAMPSAATGRGAATGSTGEGRGSASMAGDGTLAGRGETAAVGGDRADGERRRGRRGRGETGAVGTGRADRVTGQRGEGSASGETAGDASRPPVETVPAPEERRRSRTSFVMLASGEERMIVVGVTDGIRSIVIEGLVVGDSVVVGGDASAQRETTQGTNPFMPGRRNTRSTAGGASR